MSNSGNPHKSSLVAHSVSVEHETTLENASKLAREMGVDFLAVSEGNKIVGLCSVLKVNMCLSARFGHAIYADRPITQFIVKEPVIINQATSTPEMMGRVFNRDKERFYDDIILLNDDDSLDRTTAGERPTQDKSIHKKAVEFRRKPQLNGGIDGT